MHHSDMLVPEAVFQEVLLRYWKDIPNAKVSVSIAGRSRYFIFCGIFIMESDLLADGIKVVQPFL